MNTFEINGIEYEARAFDFNLICDLQDMGIDIKDADKKPLVLLRTYFAICAGRGKSFAGKEIEKHVIAGGNLGDLEEAMQKEIENSDFFQMLTSKKKAK